MKFLIASILFFSTAAQIIRNRSTASDAVDWSKVELLTVVVPPDVDEIEPEEPTKPDDSDRIIGGSVVQPHSLPFQAGLIRHTTSSVYFCGGSLISSTSVLTSAECLFESKFIVVILGAHELKSEEDEQQRQLVYPSHYRIHSDFTRKPIKNNVALLILAQPVQLNKYVQPIKLPTDFTSDQFVAEQATASGFGKVNNELYPSNLRSVPIVIIRNDVCRKYWNNYVYDTTLCMGSEGGTKGYCAGDSGGPVTINRNGETILVGVISFYGSKNCKKQVPTGCTRVTEYLDWIRKNTKN